MITRAVLDKRTQLEGWQMRISGVYCQDNDLLRYIIFVFTEGILCFLKGSFHARFAPALLADVVWRWRPGYCAASCPVLRFRAPSHR